MLLDGRKAAILHKPLERRRQLKNASFHLASVCFVQDRKFLRACTELESGTELCLVEGGEHN